MIGRRRVLAATAGAWLAAPAIARAQKFPSGRVTVVVPFPAGAATDISARIYAEKLAEIWEQPVVVDNKGGGNGIPAAESVARAKPDGLTLFATSAMTQAVNPALYDKLPYDPIADFAPITRMGTSPFVLLVDAKSPINSAAELTAKLKAAPGKNNFGAGALPARVASELYKLSAGVEATYIGYKSNPQAIPDLQNGLLSFMMIDTVNAKIAIERGVAFVPGAAFYAVDGGGHTWPGGESMPKWLTGPTTQAVDATRELWRFFQRFTTVTPAPIASMLSHAREDLHVRPQRVL